jgi:hypothetical protein
MIFVQIVALRDFDLFPTIVDCLSKSKYPRDLRFGICWQRHSSDFSLNELKEHPQFRISDVPWEQSRGLSWSRSMAQAFYGGEEYTLQITSSHRFLQNWDEILISYLHMTNCRKPILSSYPNKSDLSNQTISSTPPSMILGTHFLDFGTLSFTSRVIQCWEDIATPVRARFASNRFLFTIGGHCEDYYFDSGVPDFSVDLALSIGTFAKGYQLFHPHRGVVLQGRTTRQTLFGESEVINQEHTAPPSFQVCKPVTRTQIEEYWIQRGSPCSLSTYEVYAGVDFSTCRVHREAISGQEPPCTYIDKELWDSNMCLPFKINLRWNTAIIQSCDDIAFVSFVLEDLSGTTLYQYDAGADTVEAQGLTDVMSVSFFSSATPAVFSVQPVSLSRGRLGRVEYKL